MLISRRVSCSALLLAAFVLLVPPAATAQPSNDVLLKLLQILRDKGSISAAEYDELRLAAGASGSEPRLAAAPPPAPAVPPAPDVALAPVATPAPALLQKAAGDEIKRALAGKWYERIGFRGYTQFRLTNTYGVVGAPLEVPSDRSVNENETFMIRRGRFIFSGDVSDHFFLYAQSDFNASTGAPDFSLQMRDLYADIALDKDKTFRLRLGQSKVPFGFVNMQSSQNRAPIERPDALNSAVEGERDLGAYAMWAPARTRKLFRDLVNNGLKGSGDYGVVTVGAYSGQGLNRSDQNGSLHWLGRVSYPFTLGHRQIVELGVQAYTGRFVVPTQANTVNGVAVTPSRPAEGQADDRVAVTAVLYPQPFGFEAEWNWGTSPRLSDDARRVETATINGGYVQLHYRHVGALGTLFPFTRWQYFDGARKFARNAPATRVNEFDLGLEFARWTEIEVTAMYTHTLDRMRTGTWPFLPTTRGNRVAVQVQWNY